MSRSEGVNFATLELFRSPSTEDGTFSRAVLDGSEFCHFVELPDYGNQPNISCIPAGRYICTWHNSPTFGECYKVNDVPGRSHILMHAGNWAGDKAKGKKTNSAGCLCPGDNIAVIDGQLGVTRSRSTLDRLEVRLARRPFLLEIHPMESDLEAG